MIITLIISTAPPRTLKVILENDCYHGSWVTPFHHSFVLGFLSHMFFVFVIRTTNVTSFLAETFPLFLLVKE